MQKCIVGKKIGMTQIFDEAGKFIPVTVVEAGPCVVVQKKTVENDGYESVQLGFQDVKVERLTKPLKGHFAKADVAPKKVLREFRLEAAAEMNVGDIVDVDTFAAGDSVDVTGISKGKGFAGVMKRHGFGGGPGYHGSHFHRAPGSIGQCATPSRVFKNKKMAGQYGNEKLTVLNLEIVKVDAEKNLIAVKGAVPGAKGGIVFVRDSVKA